MADTTFIRQKAPGRNRAFGLTVAIIAHLVILTGLVLAVRSPRLFEAPVIHVTMVPAPRLLPAPRPKRPPPPPPRSRRPISPRLVQRVGPEVVAPLPIPAAPPDAAARARLFAAPFTPKPPLRAVGDCGQPDWQTLTPAERETCRARARRLDEGVPTYAVGPSDPEARAFFDKQAARNDKEERRRGGPPERPMMACDGIAGQMGCPLSHIYP